MSNPMVPVRRSSILDGYEVFTVLLYLRQQPLTKHVEVPYSSHCVFMEKKKWLVHLCTGYSTKDKLLVNPAHTTPVPLGFLFPIYARFFLLTLPQRWKVHSSPKISRLKKSSSSSFHCCTLMKKK